MSPAGTVDGFLVVDKPPGLTSHDVVDRCRRVFSQRRVGHGGSLDPDATGVLLVGLGQATRLLPYLAGLPKRYRAEVVLGVATTTLDSGGAVTGQADMSGVTLEQAQQAAAGLTGEILQVPPMVSAVHVGGRRLHELARAGVEVEREARPVRVDSFTVGLAGRGDLGPVLAIEVVCSGGTYVRVLAEDLGSALGGPAHLRDLRRTSIGPFGIEEAVSLPDLEAREHPAELVMAAGKALERAGIAAAKVDREIADQVVNGRVLPRELFAALGPGPWAVTGPDGGLLAVYGPHLANLAKPAVVLAR